MHLRFFFLNRVRVSNSQRLTYTQLLVEHPPPPPGPIFSIITLHVFAVFSHSLANLCSCHSYEYENEKTCMKNHIAGCLTGNLGVLIDPVTSLLIHQVYHCGDLKYKPSYINDRILDLIKCSQNAFMDTDFCWRYFREKLNANRSDPSLCG